MSKVIVGMSGGVDSAVCAYLLKEQGYDVVGVTLRTWIDSENEVSKCCELEDAARIARKIGIPYHIHNVGRDFCEYVTTPFVCDYLHGRTPSPCVDCNRFVKWEGMLYTTKLFDADFIATGHYACVEKLANGRFAVRNTGNAKDQSYMLYQLTQEQLSKTLFPLADYTKDRIREIAAEAGLSVANKPDSQEICFVEDGMYPEYVLNRAGEIKDAPKCEEGNFVDRNGNVLGRHKGIIYYTIGQRKGLGIAFGRPMYVGQIRTDTNEVVLCDEEDLWGSHVCCTKLNWMSIEGLTTGEEVRAKVKIRYRHDGEWAVVRKTDEDTAEITFDKPVRAATPGQAAVFYDEDGYVIGGGKICDLR